MLSIPVITISLSLPCPLQRPFAPPLFQSLFLLYCYFLCSFGLVFPVLLLLLFSSLLFYTLLHRSVAAVVTQWPFQISLSIIASDLPQASLQSAMLLDAEYREIKVSYKWCSVHESLASVTMESSVILLLLGCPCSWHHAEMACQGKVKAYKCQHH